MRNIWNEYLETELYHLDSGLDNLTNRCIVTYLFSDDTYIIYCFNTRYDETIYCSARTQPPGTALVLARRTPHITLRMRLYQLIYHSCGCD